MNDIREIAEITIRVFLKICWKFHISCAEMAQADVLLSTDDRLLRNVSKQIYYLKSFYW